MTASARKTPPKASMDDVVKVPRVTIRLPRVRASMDLRVPQLRDTAAYNVPHMGDSRSRDIPTYGGASTTSRGHVAVSAICDLPDIKDA